MSNWVNDFLAESDLSSLPIMKQSRNSIHFRQGKNLVGVFQVKPIHYLDTSKEWQPIDTSLIEIGGVYGSPGLKFVILPTGEVQYLGNSYRHLTHGIGLFEISSGKYSEVRVLPHGNRSGNKLVREVGIFRHEIIMQERGVKEQLVIQEKPVNLSGDLFVMETEFFSHVYSEGKVDDVHRYGGMVFPAGIAFDGEGNEIMVSRYVVNKSESRQNSYVGIPVSWLDSASYPVVIDPTYSEQPDATGGKDACVRSSSPNANFGTANYLGVGKYTGPDMNYSFIEFDLSSIPNGAKITTATMSMYHYGTGADKTSDTVNSYRVDASWEESTITYNNMPSVTSDFMGSLTYNPQQTGFWRNWSFDTDIMEDMVGISPTKSNYGWRFIGNTGNYYGHSFYSSDYGTASYRPKLEIVYTSNPMPSILSGTLSAGIATIGMYDARIKLRARNRDSNLTTKGRNQ